MMSNDRGRGGTGPRKPDKVVDRYCISPQLAPPVLSPRDKRMFLRTEDYHAGRGSKGDRK